ncbi:hypothetical protein [Halobacillus halophilus]|nr:hypothetical protein [Halobacillus halophilus]
MSKNKGEGRSSPMAKDPKRIEKFKRGITHFSEETLANSKMAKLHKEAMKKILAYKGRFG